jgi:hypothetical protein
MKKMILLAALPAMSAGLLAMLTSCEKPILPEGDDGNVHLTFVPTTHDVSTRGTVALKTCVTYVLSYYNNYVNRLPAMLM